MVCFRLWILCVADVSKCPRGGIYWLYGYVPRKGYGFQAIWSGIGSTNHRKLV